MKIKKYSIIIVVSLLIIIGTRGFLRSIYVMPVLMYHNIDERSNESKLSVSPESFERQMSFLRKHKYNIVSLEELVKMLKSKKPLPYKTIAVAFDDGYENNYTNGFSVLKKYRIPACIFVTVGKIGNKGFLGWQQLKEMSDSGITIGSHTMSEKYLPKIDNEEELKYEIYGSRRSLNAVIPGAGSFFAYPSGGFNENIRQMVVDAGYLGACATNPGKRYAKHDVYVLKRLRISQTSDNLFVFWIETSGFYTWIKEHRDED